MPLKEGYIEDFFQYSILIITAFTGTFVGSGFLFLGFVRGNFTYIIFGIIAVLMGTISASLLSLKQIKKENK